MPSDDLSRKEGTIRREGNKQPYIDILASEDPQDAPGSPGYSSPPGEQPGMTGRSYFDSGEDWPSVAIPEPDAHSEDHGLRADSSRWISQDQSSKFDSSKFKGHPKGAKSSLIAIDIPLPPKKKHSGNMRSIDTNMTEETCVIHDSAHYDRNVVDDDVGDLSQGLNLPRRKRKNVRNDTGRTSQLSMTSNPNRDHEPNSNQRRPQGLGLHKSRPAQPEKQLPSKSRRSTEEDLDKGRKKKKSTGAAPLDHLATSINIAPKSRLQAKQKSHPSPSSDQHSRNQTHGTNPNREIRRKESDLFEDDYSGNIPNSRSPETKKPRDIFGHISDKPKQPERPKGSRNERLARKADLPRVGQTTELLNGTIRALANEHAYGSLMNESASDTHSNAHSKDLANQLLLSPRPVRRPRKFTGSADIDVSGVKRTGSLRLDDSSIAQLEELEKLRGTTPERLDLSGDTPVKVQPGEDPPRSDRSRPISPSHPASVRSPHSGSSARSSIRDQRRASDASRPSSRKVRQDPVGRRASVGNRPRRTVKLRSPTSSMRTFPFKKGSGSSGGQRDRSATDPRIPPNGGQRKNSGNSSQRRTSSQPKNSVVSALSPRSPRSTTRLSRVPRSRNSSRRTAVSGSRTHHSSIIGRPSSKHGSTGSSTGKSTKINAKFKKPKASLSDRWGTTQSRESSDHKSRSRQSQQTMSPSSPKQHPGGTSYYRNESSKSSEGRESGRESGKFAKGFKQATNCNRVVHVSPVQAVSRPDLNPYVPQSPTFNRADE